MDFVSPGKTIGILGGGQLGRMLAMEAKRTGYYVITLDPTPKCPAGLFADKEIVAAYDDVKAAESLAKDSDVLTYEFENINVEMVRNLEKAGYKIFPGSHVLEISQDRILEKTFFRKNGIPVCDFLKVVTIKDLEKADKEVGYPAVLKTCRFGYDGKGQIVIKNKKQALRAYEQLKGQDLIWEKFVDFEKEISVICVRNLESDVVIYPIPENIHKENILDISIVPARISKKTEKMAKEIALAVASRLKVVGTFCVELFVLKNGEVVDNEIAPRPHNSGHYTMDGCIVSQFENQMRAVCNLPLGSTDLLSPVVMVNILGSDKGNDLLGVEKLFEDSNVKLHLYQKKESKLKRKMGHFTVLGKTAEEALRKAIKIRKSIYWGKFEK